MMMLVMRRLMATAMRALLLTIMDEGDDSQVYAGNCAAEFDVECDGYGGCDVDIDVDAALDAAFVGVVVDVTPTPILIVHVYAHVDGDVAVSVDGERDERRYAAINRAP